MIYIDCDDVLANFKEYVIMQTGKPYNGKETWKVLEQEDNLFYNLDLLPFAQESVSMLLDCQGYHNVQILTALPLITGKLTTAQVDKVSWVHTNIDPMIQVNCVQNWSHKAFFCESDRDILIDDSERNCDEWTKAGGIAILHTNWEDTLKKLKELDVIYY